MYLFKNYLKIKIYFVKAYIVYIAYSKILIYKKMFCAMKQYIIILSHIPIPPDYYMSL